MTFVLMATTRLLFIFFNLDYLVNCNWSEILIAYLYGFRFDFSTAFIINLFFILPSLIPYRSPWYRKLLRFLFFAFNTLFFILCLIDIELFTFFGRKLGVDFLDIGGDIQDQSLQLILNYWHMSLMSVMGGAVIWKFSKFIEQKQTNSAIRWFKVIPLNLGVLILVAIGVRGGVQMRSISPKQAFIFDKHELGNVALNAAYSIVRSMEKDRLKKIEYFKADDLAKEYILKRRDFSYSKLSAPKSNVVIIIVESLSQEYIEKGFTPHLNKLFESGLYFSENYANGRRSIEALPSILLGLPSLIGKPIYQSQFQTNHFVGLPQVLKNKGYHTSFFHGGRKGTMDFDAFVGSIGVDHYYAKEDYPQPEHSDGHWGIFDHFYFDYFIDELNTFPQPFFSTLFTLSSHQPYSLPAEFKNKFPKGTLDIHESIGYVDFALHKFFEQAKKQSWYKNTLFVLTADHTQKLETKKFNKTIGRYRVPLWFFHPSLNLNTALSKKKSVTQHADIYPSVLDILNLPAKSLLFGTSVFNEDPGAMINFNSGHFYYLKNNILVKEHNGAFVSEPQSGAVIEELKAYIQYLHNGLIKNNIYRD